MRWLTIMCVASLSSSVCGNLLANGLRGGYLGVRGKGVFGHLSPETAYRLTYNRLLGQEIGFLVNERQYTGKITKVNLHKKDLTLPSPMARGAIETVLDLQVGDVKTVDRQPIANDDLSQAIGESVKLVRLFDHSKKIREIEVWKVEMESDGDSDIDLLEAPIVAKLPIMDFVNKKYR